jgi:hypothetical protein
VQFVSNIEHGRAPLPWEKVTQLATVLKIQVEQLQAANLAIRSDFKSFVSSPATTGKRAPKSAKAIALGVGKMAGTASAVAFAAKDAQLRDIIQKYQTATTDARKRFVRAALQMLQ